MPRQRRVVRLTKAERKALETLVAQGKKSARAITRARILLLSDEGRKEREVTEILGISRGTVSNVRKQYQAKTHAHILEVLQEAPRSGRPLKLESRVAANVAMIACSMPPEGRGRWRLHLIADKVVKLEVTDAISHESVRRLLKKTASSPGSANRGVSGRSRGMTSGIGKTCSSNTTFPMLPSVPLSVSTNDRAF
jgi:putative transposase